MKKIKYFIQFLFIILFFKIFKFLGYKKSSDLGGFIFKLFGSLFRSKTIVKNNFRSAFSITVLFIFLLSISNNYSLNSLMSLNFLISFFIYYLFFIFGLNALKKNKILGFVLLSSIFFLVPNLFNSLDGVLFPITYMLYIIYIGYEFGTGYFKKWKNSEEL